MKAPLYFPKNAARQAELVGGQLQLSCREQRCNARGEFIEAYAETLALKSMNSLLLALKH